MATVYEELMIKRWRLDRPNLLISGPALIFTKKVLINVGTERIILQKLLKVTGIADDINGIDGGLMGRCEVAQF